MPSATSGKQQRCIREKCLIVVFWLSKRQRVCHSLEMETRSSSLGPTDQLRAEIRRHRDLAAEHNRIADGLESNVAAIETLLLSGAIAATAAAAATYAARPVPAPQSTKGRGGKVPGAISSKWQAILRDIAEWEVVTGEPVSVDNVIGLIEKPLGKKLRPAELKRQFEPYVAAGYMIEVGNTYTFTASGRSKIGFKKNEAPNDNVAGASEAGGAATPPDQPLDL